MLEVKQLKFKKNLLLVQEYPVQVSDKIGTVLKTDDQIKQDMSRIRFRVGKVISEGVVDEEILTSSSTKGKSLKTFKDLNILYTADAVEVIDIPVNHEGQLVLINANYIMGIVEDDDTNPNPYIAELD